MKFRKKPVIIEAVRLLPNRKSIHQVEEFVEGRAIVIEAGSIACDKFDDYVQSLIDNGGRRLKTLESDNETQIASFGDWIIKGIHGEFYPCKPDIFEETYEAV